jgi:hypothetical protein
MMVLEFAVKGAIAPDGTLIATLNNSYYSSSYATATCRFY